MSAYTNTSEDMSVENMKIRVSSSKLAMREIIMWLSIVVTGAVKTGSEIKHKVQPKQDCGVRVIAYVSSCSFKCMIRFLAISSDLNITEKLGRM